MVSYKALNTIGKNNITDADSVVTRSIPGYYVAVILA